MLEITCLAEELLASKENLCSADLVSWLVSYLIIIHFNTYMGPIVTTWNVL